jgi:hypothetical protein
VWAAEAALELGDEAAAEVTYAEAYTLGCEIVDPCWEALVLTELLELDPPITAPSWRGRCGWRPRGRCRTCSTG